MAAETTAWLVLLRGINVGGHHRVPMAELRGLLEGLGHRDVRTLIASGNAVLRAGTDDEAALVEEISAALADRFGFDVPVVARRQPELEHVAALDPFPDADPALVHVHFLAQAPPAPLVAALDLDDLAPEAAVVEGRHLVVHHANGSARSTIGPALRRQLGGHDLGTARNRNTVAKLVELLRTA